MDKMYASKLDHLAQWRESAKGMGGPETIAKQHKRGKLTCRERLDVLLDPESFVELGILAQSEVEVPGKGSKVAMAGGVLVGMGKINGRKVFITADDATVVSGARGASGRLKANRVNDMALRQKCPMIALMEASAGRIQDQMGSKLWASQGYDPHITGFGPNVDLSGMVPTVTAVMGNCVGRAAFIAGLSDFVPMVQGTSFMAVAGPLVVAGATGEIVDPQDLGGCQIHTTITGQADYAVQDDAECMSAIRNYLSYFPSNCYELPPRYPTNDDPHRRCEKLVQIVPTNLRHSYNMYDVIATITDDGAYFPIKKDYGRALITCLARIDGYSVGIVASQPAFRAGVMDDQASYKAIHFMELCDAFHIPLIFLVDVPGFIIGRDWERRSMIKWVARALVAHRKLSVPKITVIIRKAYGLAYWIMGGKAMSPDLIAAWPTASFSLMAAEPAVNVIYEREIKAAPDPEAARQRYLEVFQQQYAPDDAAKNFGIDDIIDPHDTRSYITKGLDMVLESRKYHLGFKHTINP